MPGLTSVARCAAIPVAMLFLTAPAAAASYVATSATLKSVFANAGSGDTIVLRGSFGTTVLSGRSFASPLRIDARAARFDSTLVIRDMRGLSVTGGSYGSGTGTWQNGGTIRVEDSQAIRFTQPKLVGDGLGKARGLTFIRTDDYNVTGGSFSGFRIALAATGTRDGVLANNRITKSTSDGINISNSHSVIARGNHCSGTNPSAGAHPDCIQLWSLAGNPVQSDIQLLYNTAIGETQGFTSFDPARGGGLRISMIGNRVNTGMPQGIACYNCVDSIITDNILTTLPGSRFRTYLRVIGGSNNIVEGNSIGPGPYPTAEPPFTTPDDPLPSSSSSGQSALFARAALSSSFAAAAVPEPGIWAQCIIGFALLGGALRRRRSLRGGSSFQMQLQELAHVGQYRRAASKGF